MEQSLVYIIVLNYNGWENTIECIESLRKIEYQNYKVIIVDNCSTDDSVEKINNYINENEMLIIASENSGYAAGNNIGIDYAIENNAEYVMILNNDVIVEKSFLDKMVAGFNNEIGIITPKVYYYKSKIINSFGAYKNRYGSIRNIGQGLLDDGTFDKDKYVSFVMGCCMLIKSDVIKNVGKMSEEFFMYIEESDFCLRVSKKYKLLVKADAHIWHKEGGSTNNSLNRINYFTTYYGRRNTLYFVQKNYKWRECYFYYIIFFISDIKNIILNIGDSKHTRIIIQAWKDFISKKLYRNDYIQTLIKK